MISSECDAGSGYWLVHARASQPAVITYPRTHSFDWTVHHLYACVVVVVDDQFTQANMCFDMVLLMWHRCQMRQRGR